MRRFRIALLAALPTLVACSETFTTAPAVPLVAGIAPATARSAGQTRPFSGRCDTDYGTYTAANGDQLFATWTGTATSVGPLNTFSGPQTTIGGTGRFAGATGSTWIAGTASFVTFTGQFTSEGTLIY